MWSGISRFFGNLTGGLIGESDDERRRREEAERRARQKQTQSIGATPKPLNLATASQSTNPVQQGFGIRQADPFSQNTVQPLSLAKPQHQEQQSPLKIDENVVNLPGIGRYTRQADGTYKSEQGQTRTSEQVRRLRRLYQDDQSRQAEIAKEGVNPLNVLKEVRDAPVTIGKHLGSGIQQVGGSIVDTAIQGGAMLDELAVQLKGGSEEEKSRRRLQNLRNSERLRGVLHSGRDLLGEELVGNRDVDEAASRIASGNASAGDFLQLGGKSLDIGLGATMPFNPTRQLVSGVVGRATNKEVLQFALRDGLFFGTGDAVAAGSQVYGQTGDIKDAVKAASLAFLMSGGGQFGLDVGGQVAGRAIRGGANATKNAVASAGTNSMSGFVKSMKTNLVRDAIRRYEADLGRSLTNEEKNAAKKAVEAEIETEWQEIRKEQKAIEAESERQQQEQSDISLEQPAPGNAIDPQAYLAELQRRRQEFEQNPDLAEALELENTRQREASYDPTEPVSRMNVAEKLTQLGIKSSDLRKLNEAGGNARIYQQILEQMEARGFVPDNPVAYIRGVLNKIKEQNRYNPTLAAMRPRERFEPAVNDMGEVITDQNGRPLSKEEYERLTNQEARQEDGQVNRVVNDSKPDPEDVEPRPTKPVEKAEQIAEEQGQTINHGKNSEASLFDDPNFGVDKTATLARRDLEKAKAEARNTTIDSQGNTVDTDTGEILDGPKTEPYTYRDEDGDIVTGFREATRPTPEPETPPKTYRTVEDMVNKRPTDGTYKSEKAFVRDVDAYAQKIGRRVEEQLAKDGGDFEGMFDHVDGLWQRWAAGERNLGVKDIDPKYRKAYTMLRKELDKMYANRKGQDLEGRAKGDEITGDQGPFYIPHRSTQEGGSLSTLDELDGLNRDHSVLSRTTGQMADADKSTNLIRKYAIEMLGGNKVRKAEQMVEQSKIEVKEGIREKELTPEEAMAAVTKREQVMDNLGNAATLKKGKKLASMDVVKELEELGTVSGYKKNVIDAKMDDAFYKEAYRRLGSVQSNGRPIDQDAGISQYYGAESDARALMDSMKKKDEIGQVVADHLKKDMNYMSDAEITEIIGRLDRDLDSMVGRDLSPEEVTALRREVVRRALEGAARVNMTNFLQRTEMTDPGLRRVMNIHARNMLVNGRARNTLATKIASILTNAQDMALRGWNFKSAAVEFSDITNMISMYGVKTAGRAMKDVAKPGAMKDMLAKYGRSNSYAVHREMLAAMKMKSKDLEDFYQSIADKDTKKTLKYIKDAADPRMMIKAAEIFKQAAALRAAEIKFTPIAKQKGWSQVELHRAIRDEARRTALTNDQESFLRIQENPIAAASFQYWQWNIRFMAQNGRLIAGRENLGTIKDRKSRARYTAYQLAQRTALWTALSASGSSVAYSFGVFDPFGIFEDNWDGIDDEDMTAADTVMQYGSVSPLTSLVGSAYFAYRQEQERAEAFANDDERKQGIYGYRERRQENESINSGEKLTPEEKEAQRQDNAKFSFDNVIDNFQQRTPFGNMLPGTTQARKSLGAHELNEKGYSESRDGRVQYQAPEKGSFDYYMSYVFGKSATNNAQEYYDRPQPFEAIKKGDLNGFINELRKDTFFSSTIGKLIGSTKNSHRPLTNSFDGGFNKKALDSFKAAVEKSGGVHTKEARDALSDWIQIGRKYNRVLDNFKKDSPDEFKKWQETFDDNIISPEKWAIYAKNPKVWEFARERKKLEAKHLDRVVDPVFQLDAEKAKVVMEERSMLTGDDMLQRSKLYKYKWYKDFKEQERKYYEQFGSEDADEPNRGKRAKEWFGYSKSLYELRNDKKNYPAVSKFYEINDKYGYESPEMEAFWDTPEGQAYQDQKVKYDEARLEIVNKMRKIEGAEPLTWEQFRAKLKFEEPADEDDGKSNGYWKDGKFYKTGGYRKGSGSSKKKSHSTGVEDTVPGLGSTPSAIKQVRAKPAELKDAKKAFKKPRASGMSKIRVKI